MYALLVKELKKTYGNGLVALKGINFSVKEGDFFALLGPNGAGKSTTIGILSSLVNKTSGTVSVFGINMDTHLEGAKACIGIVPQEMNFNPFERVIDIVMNQAGYYGIERKVAEPRALFYLEKMGLIDKCKQSALRLSGGMKRRLMIARALVNNPKLLILDEPTAGVDIELRYSLWDFLKDLNDKGTTIILTTHYLEEAEKMCKNVAIIDHGQIIENSDMKTLINRLNIQSFIIELSHSITHVPDIHPFKATLIDSHSIEVLVHKDQSLNNLFDILNKNHIHVSGLRNKTNRLEELFVNLISGNKGKNHE